MIIGKDSDIYSPTVILDDEHHVVEIGDNCVIGQFSFIGARYLIMEDHAEICPGCMIGGGGDVTLKESSTLAFGVKLIPASFTTQGKYMNDRVNPDDVNTIRGSIEIGKGAYIGSGAVICVSKDNPHITIGENAVVGALTYVDRDVLPGTIIHNKRTHETLEVKRRNYEI